MDYVLVLISGIIAFMVGGLWYSPILFGNKWAIEMGVETHEDFDKLGLKYTPQQSMGFSFILSLIKAYILFFIFPIINIVDIQTALIATFVFWVVADFFQQLKKVWFESHRHTFTLAFINTGETLVELLVITLFLFLFVY